MTDDLHGRIEDLIPVCVIEMEVRVDETWSSTMIVSLSLTITDELPTTASEPVPTA
jgi:hypothetical protein